MMDIKKNIIIREPLAKDAGLIMEFGNRLLGESTFYIRAPGERANTPEAMLHIIDWYKTTDRQIMLHAWVDNLPVGEIVVMAAQLSRTSKCAQLGIGVLKSHQGTGVGKALMQKAEDYAIKHGIHRIEFTVLHHNDAAYKFYKAQGYAEEGRKKQSVYIEASYYDEIMMGKILSPLP